MKKLLFSFFKVCLFILLIGFPYSINAAEQTAVFAGGCFWCLEHDLQAFEGVLSVESGYSGGDLLKPTYQNHKGHQESVLVRFDESKISYESLLRGYWRNIDPYDNKGQFCDRGDSYRPVIFTNDENQALQAKQSNSFAAKELNSSLKDIRVQIKPFNQFWLAEEYHQDFAELNSLKYSFYRYSCGRDKRLEEIWDKKAKTIDAWNQ